MDFLRVNHSYFKAQNDLYEWSVWQLARLAPIIPGRTFFYKEFHRFWLLWFVPFLSSKKVVNLFLGYVLGRTFKTFNGTYLLAQALVSQRHNEKREKSWLKKIIIITRLN